MDDALMINGVGIGWTLDFGLTDWLVPAGAWSHTGSHIEAVARVAEGRRRLCAGAPHEQGAGDQAALPGGAVGVEQRYPGFQHPRCFHHER